MTLPDKAADASHQEFQWDGEDSRESNVETRTSSSTETINTPNPQGTATTSIEMQCTNGTTIVFDSFSDEQDVRRRNLSAVNISKVRDSGKRFHTNFTIQTSGEVAAILSASTVADYRQVDARQTAHPPSSTYTPPTTTTATTMQPSFSSILTAAPPATKTNDQQLVLSLAAAACMTVMPLSAYHASKDDELRASLAALSSVASSLLPMQADGETRGIQPRKRRRTAVPQPRGDVVGDLVDMSSPASPAHMPSMVAIIKCGNVRDAPTGTLLPIINTTRNAALLADSTQFFSAVIRPVAVHQALRGINCSGTHAQRVSDASLDRAPSPTSPLSQDDMRHGDLFTGPSTFLNSMDEDDVSPAASQSDIPPQSAASGAVHITHTVSTTTLSAFSHFAGGRLTASVSSTNTHNDASMR